MIRSILREAFLIWLKLFKSLISGCSQSLGNQTFLLGSDPECFDVVHNSSIGRVGLYEDRKRRGVE